MPTKNRVKVTTLTVKVARFGSNPVSVKVSKGASVQDALTNAGVSLSSTDKVYIDGVRVGKTDALQAGDIISVISPKAAGNVQF